MRKTRVLGVLLAFVVLASCDSSGGAGYGFQNQNLQGKIDGVSWTYVSGTGVVSGSTIEFYLYDIPPAAGDPWAFDAYFAATSKIMFTISPVSTGLHELGFGPGLETVTLVEYPSDNFICAEGAVEILSIDTLNSLVTGRIDARLDSDNFVNGNFTAAYQP